MIDIRPVRPEEFERFRELRLRSLRDSPHAFGSTEAVEALFGFDQWKQWVSERPEYKVLVAEEGGVFVGTCSLAPILNRPEQFNLFALWVAPQVRRTGVGKRLVQALIDFGATTHRKRIRVFVAEKNDPALSLFYVLGFEDTGERYTLREDLPVDAWVLERSLRDAPPPQGALEPS